MGHDGLTLTGCQHVGTQTNDTAGGDIKLDVHTLALTLHRGHLTLTTGYHINHLRRELLRHIDREFLYRFMLHAVDLLINHLGLTHLQLITLATHGLNKYREVQHATARDNPLIRRVLKRLHTQCEVLLKFFLQTVIDMA